VDGYYSSRYRYYGYYYSREPSFSRTSDLNSAGDQ